MGRVVVALALTTLALASACGARSGTPDDEPAPTLLSPAVAAGGGAAAKAGAGGSTSAAGTAGGPAKAGGSGSAGSKTSHPCGDCVASFGSTGCVSQLALCQQTPACLALHACMVNNGCLDAPEPLACAAALCPSFITASSAWTPYALCGACLPACIKECAGGGVACAKSVCAHDLCQTGASLDASCDPCVLDTCKLRPQCCDPASSVGWDLTCTQIAHKLCGACLE